MKILIIILFSFLLFACIPKDEAAWQVLNAADYLLTERAIDQGATEINPLPGENPSDTSLVLWWAGTSVAHYYVSENIGPKYRPFWIWSTLIIKGFTVGNNIIVVEW